MGSVPTRAGRALLDSFESIRIVNLAHRADRRREVAGQLARLGLSFDNPQIALFDARKFSDAGTFPTIGARGCFHSHIDILNEAADKGLRSILVLEDDVDFHADIETLLPAALEALESNDWAFFQGSALPGHYTATERPIEPLKPGIFLPGSHFYALRGDAIARAVKYLEPMASRPAGQRHPDGDPMHYDGALALFRERNPEVRSYMANPDLAYQRLSRTDIHKLPFYDRLPVLREGASLLRGALKAAGYGQLRRK